MVPGNYREILRDNLENKEDLKDSLMNLGLEEQQNEPEIITKEINEMISKSS